jgi:hypothetical protein
VKARKDWRIENPSYLPIDQVKGRPGLKYGAGSLRKETGVWTIIA